MKLTPNTSTATTAAVATTDDDCGCAFEGKDYSSGAEICSAGSLLQCRGDEWVYVGACTRDDDSFGSPFGPAIAVIADFLRNDASEDALQQFAANPTDYISVRLQNAGITVPDSFEVVVDDEVTGHTAQNVFVFAPAHISLKPLPIDADVGWIDIHICINIRF